MFKLLLILLITLPIIELWGLISVGKWLGAWPTIGTVIFTAALGAWLTKREGLQTLQQVRWQLARREMPTQAVVDGICILVGGIMLIIPGFFTDLVGFILLLPYTRNIIKAWLNKKFTEWIKSGRFIILKR